jgi:hypothetical protein
MRARLTRFHTTSSGIEQDLMLVVTPTGGLRF